MKAAGETRSHGAARRVVRLARPADDEALRGLLAARPMEGSILLAMEREPSYFVSLDLEAERHTTVVVEADPEDACPPHSPREDGGGAIFAMGARLVHRVALAGESALLGYLSHLRLAPGAPFSLRGMREAWACLLDERGEGELPFDLTSIASGNEPARRLLERGLPGMPRYHPVGEYEVQALPTVPRGREVPGVRVELAEGGGGGPGTAASGGEVAGGDGEAPAAALVLRGRGAGPSTVDPSFQVTAWAGGEPVAGFSVVDPTPWRQYVVRGYQGALAWGRPLANLALHFQGAPLLPPPGGRLRSGFITGFWCRQGQERALPSLVRAAAAEAGRKGLASLLHGAMAEDPQGEILASGYRPRRYRSTLYLVARAEPTGALEALRRGPIHIDPIVL